jgi:hypothetical protein
MKKLFILFIAVAMVAAFTIPVAAADWSFKGDARMNTYSHTVDKNAISGSNFDATDTTWAKSDVLSRFAATAKGDNVVGYIEIRPNVTSFVRHWYGSWTFGSGKLLVGKTWAPLTMFSNAQNDSNNKFGQFGNIEWAAARIDQIRLTFGGLVLGFLSPNGSVAGVTGGSADHDVDTTIPTLEAKYTFKFEPVTLTLMGGYASYDFKTVDTDSSQSVDSYVVGADVKANFGPGYIKANAHSAVNGKTYGLNYGSIGTAAGNAKFEGNQIIDSESFGYALVGGWKASDMIKLELGYSYLEAEMDEAGSKADDASALYVQAVFTLAPGVTIAPEVGIYDYGDDENGLDEGDDTYFGATWKIAF